MSPSGRPKGEHRSAQHEGAPASPPVAGTGIMLLLFDVAAPMVVEHDDWHTHEHMPERLGIPGFLRGTRWVAAQGSPRYCVTYEVASLAVLDSEAYRARLDAPTPWTAAMMKHYVGMQRTLCEVEAAGGAGVGGAALVVRFAPAPGGEAALSAWLHRDVVPTLPACRGLASCVLIRNALAARMTAEQAIRGQDAAVDRALIVTGYDEGAVAALARNELGAGRFAANGAQAASCVATAYRLAYRLEAAGTA